MYKDFWKAALIRAVRTVCQNLASTIPVGIVVTPVMLQQMDISVVYIVLAWLATGLLAGVVSLLTSIATGLPEVDNERCYAQMVQECNELREENDLEDTFENFDPEEAK